MRLLFFEFIPSFMIGIVEEGGWQAVRALARAYTDYPVLLINSGGGDVHRGDIGWKRIASDHFSVPCLVNFIDS